MTAVPMTAAEHYASAMADAPGSRERAGWDRLVGLGVEAATSSHRDIAWHSLAQGEYFGALDMFALFNGLARAELKTFVSGLVREQLDADAAEVRA